MGFVEATLNYFVTLLVLYPLQLMLLSLTYLAARKYFLEQEAKQAEGKRIEIWIDSRIERLESKQIPVIDIVLPTRRQWAIV